MWMCTAWRRDACLHISLLGAKGRARVLKACEISSLSSQIVLRSQPMAPLRKDIRLRPASTRVCMLRYPMACRLLSWSSTGRSRLSRSAATWSQRSSLFVRTATSAASNERAPWWSHENNSQVSAGLLMVSSVWVSHANATHLDQSDLSLRDDCM